MAAIATLPVLFQEGIHSARPAASAVGSGGLYSCTTHSLVYQTDGSSWSTWATLGGAPSGSAGGDLSGTYPNPDVDAIQGVTISGTPTTGDVPTATGASAATWQAPTGGGGGSLVLLEQHTASASATLDFTTFISSAYDTYLFDFVGLINATNTVQLWMRMGTGGGPTYDTGANYEYTNSFFSAGGNGQGGGTGQVALVLSGTGAGIWINNNDATVPVFGQLKFWLPSSTAFHKMVQGEFNYKETTANVKVYTLVRGEYDSTTAVTAVRFMFSSGNITSGTIRCYGLKNT